MLEIKHAAAPLNKPFETRRITEPRLPLGWTHPIAVMCYRSVQHGLESIIKAKRIYKRTLAVLLRHWFLAVDEICGVIFPR